MIDVAIDLVKVLKHKVCPMCKMRGRLLAGPGYERHKIRCQNCGFRFKIS